MAKKEKGTTAETAQRIFRYNKTEMPLARPAKIAIQVLTVLLYGILPLLGVLSLRKDPHWPIAFAIVALMIVTAGIVFAKMAIVAAPTKQTVLQNLTFITPWLALSPIIKLVEGRGLTIWDAVGAIVILAYLSPLLFFWRIDVLLFPRYRK